ncbi:DUF4215 domain-containing protein [bacterium]|nr:DUF4215 domain-containing protein [bacterium]
MTHRCPGLAFALLLVAMEADAAIDLTGKWRVEYGASGTEIVDLAQSGSAVTATLAPGGVPVAMSGTVDDIGLSLSLSVPGCAPPACFATLSARLLPDGTWLDGVLVLGAPPLPGTSRVLGRRCECFDGNSSDGDGCSAACRIEPCFSCVGMPSTCTPTPDGGTCEDGSPCTAGTTCSAGQCGGGGSVSPCIDLRGVFDVHYESGFVAFDTAERVEQFGETVLFRDAAGGTPGLLGHLDFLTGALALDVPVTYILCIGVEHATGTAALDGSAFTLSGSASVPTLHGCLADAYGATGVRRTTCGDGVVVAPEQCDDGNTTSGDGCDANCTATGCGNGVRTSGEACDDGNTTSGDGCAADCTVEPCWTCVGAPASACSTAYTPHCARPQEPRRATVRLARRADAARDLIGAKTGKTSGLPMALLGDPLTSAAYQVCLYDRSLPLPRLLFGARVPAGGTCGGSPCWRAVSGGFAYRDASGAADGITTLRVVADRHGRGEAIVAGRGSGLLGTATGLPELPLPVPLEVQVQNAVNADGCFAIDVPTVAVVRNDAASGRFVARGAP